MWKFQGDRPSHLGDIAPQSATKKKETTAKHKPTWNYRSGWPNAWSLELKKIDGVWFRSAREALTFVRALAPEPTGRGDVDARRRSITVVRHSLDRVQPVVRGDGDEQAEERRACARRRGSRQRPVRRYTAHDDVIDDVSIHRWRRIISVTSSGQASTYLFVHRYARIRYTHVTRGHNH